MKKINAAKAIAYIIIMLTYVVAFGITGIISFLGMKFAINIPTIHAILNQSGGFSLAIVIAILLCGIVISSGLVLQYYITSIILKVMEKRKGE